jgi:hypothetical protein
MIPSMMRPKQYRVVTAKREDNGRYVRGPIVEGKPGEDICELGDRCRAIGLETDGHQWLGADGKWYVL